MNYTKPEVAILGQAVQVIELLHPTKIGGNVDSSQVTNPAYDLDE